MDVFDVKAIEIDQILVKDVMSPPTMTASRGETVSDVISKMKKNNVREIPVIEDGKPVGLISYGSFIARRNVPLSAKAEHIMTPCPRLEEDMKLVSAAEEMMSSGVRGAPVVRNHKLVGFLSRTDIIKIIPTVDQLKDRPVNAFMSAHVQSVTGDDSVRKAQALMKGLNEKTLPVVDEANRLVGAIGMTEIMNVLWNPKNSKRPNEVMGADHAAPDIKVLGVMNRSPVFISPSDTIDKAVKMMLDKNLTTLFVTENGKLVGVVSHADMMEQFVGLKPREGVYIQITGLDAEDPEVYDTLYDQIGKSLKRVDKIDSPRMFTVHMTVHNHEGMRAKYSISARLTTEHGMYYARAVEWDLFKAMDSVLDMAEKNIKREHEKRLDKRKGNGKGL